MKDREELLKKLIDYQATDYYPFHMPGHKRQKNAEFAVHFPNPFSIDITEIHGFDNLHHPEGILKESMEWAAGVYGADRTYYLINGSSSGILSAILGTTSHGGNILMSRNCHKSAYHGVYLNHLTSEYVYPQIISEFGIQGGLLPEDIRKMLITYPKTEAVLIVSPTYDGVVSDIKEIASIVHEFGVPLIVDEAHGAHFPFGRGKAGFPMSALDLGADVVVQSLHKTLPSFTQTAVMHVKKGFVSMEKIDRFTAMFQSSSPSYILMAGIENCIRWMDQSGQREMERYAKRLIDVRRELSGLSNLKLLPEDLKGRYAVFALDLAKIVVSSGKTGVTGEMLFSLLRDQYHLDMEMCGPNYVTAITSVADTAEGLVRLVAALREIDERILPGVDGEIHKAGMCEVPVKKMSISQAMDGKQRKLSLEECAGKISCEFIYLYPPGIPLIVPGEVVDSKIIEMIQEYKRMGLPVQGTEDKTVNWINVI